MCIRDSLVTGNAIGQESPKIAIEGFADEIERGQALDQFGRVPRHVSIFVHREGACIAGGVVGQHMQLCLLLKNIEKVAAEAIEPVVVGCHAGNGRVDCRCV